MSLSWKTEIQTVIHSYNGTRLSNKKGKDYSYTTRWLYLEGIVLMKETRLQKLHTA